MIFKCNILNGKVDIINKVNFANYLKTCKPGAYNLELKRPKKYRSNEQNKYYWGVAIQILANEFGYFENEMHEILKAEFLKEHNDNKPDRIKSTTELSTIEFEMYLDKIRIWSLTEFNIYIPLPNEADK